MKPIRLLPGSCTATMTMLLFATQMATADDWPLLGRDKTRNAVSPEQHAPTDWAIGKFDQGKLANSRNIKWAAQLGSSTFGTPVVVGGLVWIGTNNQREPPSGAPIAAVLMCFRESDGKRLYEYVSPRLPNSVNDNGWNGLGCSPLVEGDRLWFTTNRCETVCLDIGPLKRGQGEPQLVWKVDMMNELGVFPRALLMGPARTCSIAASYKDRIFVVTGNGVDEGYSKIPAPQAPSLICLDKNTGEVHWKDNSPGGNILHAQLSSPLVIEINGRGQVITPQGDGWVRSFDALTGEAIWAFDINPKTSKWALGGRGARNEILATPVFHDGRIYIASGQYPEHGDGPGRLCCIDPTKTGDISSELAVDAEGTAIPHRRFQAVDPSKGERATPNPNSGLVWEYVQHDRDGDGKISDDEQFQRSISNVAIKNDLLIATDYRGMVHCLDARTGKPHWAYDPMASISSSPLIVGDNVHVADEDGDVAVFRLSADPEVAMKQEDHTHVPLAVIQMDGAVFAAPIFANGTLYVATRNWLFAIQEPTKRGAADRAGGFWPQWRGPNRDNVSTETGLLKEWPEAGPPLVWKVEGIGDGEPSVAVAGGRVFTLGYIGEHEYAVALDEATGEKAWQVPIGPTMKGQGIMRWLSQRTPTVDGERVYVFGAFGDLVCLRTSDGKELWRRNYSVEFEGKKGNFGFCDYPLVDGERLICTPGGEKAAMVALDKRTGEVIWTCRLSNPEASSHSAVVAAEIEGVRQYVNILQASAIGVAAADGRLLWQQPGISRGAANTNTPIVRGNEIVCITSGPGSVLLKFSRTADRFAVSAEARRSVLFQPWLDSVVLIGDQMYTYNSGVLSCVKANGDEVVWQARVPEAKAGRAPITWADERLYVRCPEGTMLLIEATPKGHEIKGTFQGPHLTNNPSWSFPVVAGRRLYLRDQHALFCYDVSRDALEKQRPEAKTVVLPAPAPRAASDPAAKSRTLRSIFVPTPQDVVEKMLELAAVRDADLVYDLGSGEGRILITAAKKYGCRTVGYEIDRELVAQSRENAKIADVEQLVRIEHQDLFTADLSSADVIALYLLPSQLEKLLPQLAKLRPGARIVSHEFQIPGVPPDKMIEVESKEDANSHKVYLWTAPIKKP